jgi:hypothetical protein
MNPKNVNLIVMQNSLVADDATFAKFIMESIEKYRCKNWGDTCPEDSELNNQAVSTNNRIVAKYKFKSEAIFIITEWNKEVTTILFSNEY